MLYSVKTLAGVLLLLAYTTGIDLVELFKVPLILAFLMLVVYNFSSGFRVTRFSLLGSISFTSALFIGLIYQNEVGAEFFSHCYSILMPIFAINAGYIYSDARSEKDEIFVERIINVIFFINILTLSGYYYLHYVVGSVAYFGFDTELPLVAAFAIAKRKYSRYILIFALILLSGKRAPLVATLIVGAFHYSKQMRSGSKGVLFSLVALSALFICVFTAYKLGLLYRFTEVARTDVDDSDSFFLSTSGRSWEFAGIFRYLNESPIRWLTGGGLGAQYEIEEMYGTIYTVTKQHYTHLSILSYAFLVGPPIAVSLLIYLSRYVFIGRFLNNSAYYWSFVALFCGGFFGATWLIEAPFWFCLGVVVRSVELRNRLG